jgi:N-acylneuraminate cytidylyltransferase
MLRILIPARGGSKRIKNKNLLKVNGESLLSRAIRVSLQITNEVYVSTDSLDIEKEAILNGAKIHKRPSIYATDISPTKEAIVDFLNSYNDTVNMVLVQCTSPFINLNHLKTSIKNLDKYSSSISVYKETPFYWEKNSNGAKPNYDPFNKPRTQDMSPRYKETGAFYSFKVKSFVDEGVITPSPTALVEVDLKSSFDIDTMEEYELIKSCI